MFRLYTPMHFVPHLTCFLFFNFKTATTTTTTTINTSMRITATTGMAMYVPLRAGDSVDVEQTHIGPVRHSCIEQATLDS